MTTEVEERKDIPKRLGKITIQVLDRIEDKLDDGDSIPLKDLKDTLFGLLEHGRGPLLGGDSSISQAAKGAVLGALQGLASLSGAEFDKDILSQPRVVSESGRVVSEETASLKKIYPKKRKKKEE